MPSKRSIDLHYIAMQVAFWAAFAAICAYQATLLLARGFDNTQVGVIVALRCLAGVVAQPLLGSYADKHPGVPLKAIVSVCLGVAFFAGLALMIPMGLVGTSLLFIILGALEISAYPLMDAMAVQFIQAGADLSYSFGRGLGSLAYALVCVFLGFQAGRFGVETTLWTHSLLTIVLIAAVLTFPRFDPAWQQAREAARKPKNAWRLLRDNPRFAVMLLGILLGITAVLPMSNFLINIIRSRGGGETHLGVALFLMAAFELPAAILFDKLYRRGRAGKILVASMVFMTLKALLMIFAQAYWVIWLVEPIQMLGYGLFTPASVLYVSDAVDPVDQVKGQTLMMVASNGLGGVMGSVLAGRALDVGGVDAMLWMCVGLGAASIVVTALAVWWKARR